MDTLPPAGFQKTLFSSGDSKPSASLQGEAARYDPSGPPGGSSISSIASSCSNEFRGSRSAREASCQGQLFGPDSTSLVKSTTSSHRYVTIMCINCAYKFPVLLHCNDRTCPLCRADSRKRLFAKYIPLIKKIHRPKHLVLTWRSRTYITKQWIIDFRAAFNKLLRIQPYDKLIRGGVYAFEATHGAAGWHLHIHCIYDGEWVDRDGLSKVWKRLTGGSWYVWIKEHPNPKKALSYVLDYITKDIEFGELTEEFNRAWRGMRMFQSFGTLYNALPTREPVPCPNCHKTHWISEFEWDSIIRQGRSPPYDSPERPTRVSKSAHSTLIQGHDIFTPWLDYAYPKGMRIPPSQTKEKLQW